MPQFMIFITLKIRDRTCLKIEKTWFLLVHQLAKKNSKGNNKLLQYCPDRGHCQRLVLLHYFYQKIFQDKTAISKNRHFFGQNFVLATRETMFSCYA